MNIGLYVDLPEELYDELRERAHINKKTKRDIVVEALQQQFKLPPTMTTDFPPRREGKMTPVAPPEGVVFMCSQYGCKQAGRMYEVIVTDSIEGEVKNNLLLCPTHRDKAIASSDRVRPL